jgi:hypothetical protein
MAGYPAGVVYPLNDSAGGTAVWTTIPGGPVTDIVQVDSGQVRSATQLRWQLHGDQWVATGWRVRAHEDDGTLSEVDVTYSPDGNVTTVPHSLRIHIAQACVVATAAAMNLASRLILPSPLYAQSSSECWRFSKVGPSEALSFDAQAPDCFNYGMNAAISWFTPSALDVIQLAGALGSATAGAQYMIDTKPTLRGKLPALLRSGPRIIGVGTVGLAGTLFLGAMAVNMHQCYNNPVTTAQRSACRGGAPSGNPKLGSMGNALGMSSGALRGIVSQFWGVANTN